MRLLTEGEHLIRIMMIIMLEYFEDDNIKVMMNTNQGFRDDFPEDDIVVDNNVNEEEEVKDAEDEEEDRRRNMRQ